MSSEPGLWAGDEPRASQAPASGQSELLGVLLPGQSGSDRKLDVGPALACTALWNHALPGTALTEKVNALRPAEKQCMVAWMFHTCVRVIEQLDDNTSEDGVVVLLVRQKRAALRKSASESRQGSRMATDDNSNTPIEESALYDPAEDELIRQSIARRLAQLSPEEGHKWRERMLAKLLRTEIIPAPQREGDGE